MRASAAPRVALALALLFGCQATPPEPSPPVLLVGGAPGQPVLFATRAGRQESLVLVVEGLELHPPHEGTPVRLELAVRDGKVEPGRLDDLPPGRYRAQLRASVVVPERGRRELASEALEFELPRRFHLVRTRDVVPGGAPIDLRVRLVLHPDRIADELVASVARAAVDAAFTQVQPLVASAEHGRPWEDLELNRIRALRTSGEEELLPEMDPEALLVVDHRPADARFEIPEQIVARLYDLSCREYDYPGHPGPVRPTMQRALIFEEFVEVQRRGDETTAVDLLDAWRRLIGALEASPRFRAYQAEVRGPARRLTREGASRHLLGDVSAPEGGKAHHERVERDVLFPASRVVVPFERAQAAPTGGRETP